MFRRREDGSEELINDNEGATVITNPTTQTAATPVTPTAATPSAPASQPSAPAFRPVPPQAAMVAASRSAMPSPAQPSPMSASDAARPAAATPVNRPTSKRVLTVGPDIQMKGEITSCDRVVIEGSNERLHPGDP
ncbi:MAG: hypothetical protein ACOYNL_07400, partial [Rickettsiales bacterium]